MAQTYTLEEAAGRIGLPVDEFKRRMKLEWTTIRSFRDGATLRYRAADIDDLARALGQASDPGLQLAPPKDGSSTEYLVNDDSAIGGDDIFSLDTGHSSKRTKKRSADSDVRIERDDGGKSGRRRDPDGTPTEEIALDLDHPAGKAGKKTGNSSAKLTAPKTGPNLGKSLSSTRIPSPQSTSDSPDDSSSEFELSLDADSDSFELSLNPDESDEVDLGGMGSKSKSRQSGIDLGRPKDSGVSLQDHDSDDFELSLDAEPAPSKRSLAGPKSVKIPMGSADHSDSEFELTLDDNSGVTDALADQAEKGDIFETDFELPAVTDDADSGSEVVAVDSSDTDLENSDFDLALDESDIEADDESASQVVLLDDEEAPAKSGRGRHGAAAAGAAAAGAAAGASRKRRPAEDDDAVSLDDMDDDDGDSASSALRNVPKRRTDEDDDGPVKEARPASWGLLPAMVLLPCLLLTFIGGIMSFELLRGMWGYQHGAKPSGTIVRALADTFDMDPKE